MKTRRHEESSRLPEGQRAPKGLVEGLEVETPSEPRSRLPRTSGEVLSPEERPALPGWFRALPWGLGGLGMALSGGAVAMLLLGGAGWALTLFCLAPLGLAGLLLLALALAGWWGVWLMLEVRQPPGETPQRLVLGLPLPLGLLPLALRLAQPWWGDAWPVSAGDIEEILRVLRDEPLWLTVDDDDGTQVRLWLGRAPTTLP